MTVVTPLAPGEHPAGFPHGSGHPAVPGPREAIRRILAEGARSGRLTHIEEIPGRSGELGVWPDWVPPALATALNRAGITAPWVHQATAAGHAHAGRNVIISTGTASGKSVGYLLPALAAALDGGTVLYIAPTRALAADQLRLVKSLEVPGVRPAVVRRGHPVQRAHLGPGTRQLPADHAGHAAPHAAAAARQVERFPAPPAVRDRGRMPQLPRGVRLACGPGPAPPAAHRGLPPAGRPPLGRGRLGGGPEGPARRPAQRAALLPLHRCSFWRRRR